MKQRKGITLIALIITIVVMLILVGVTVSFTIGENGILSQAKQAKVEQDKATEKEELIIEAYATYGKEAKFNKAKFKVAIEEKGYTFNETTGQITTPKGYKFIIDEEGKIEEGEIQEEIDFNGIYYGFNNLPLGEIKNNNTMILGEEFPLTIDKTNKTIAVDNGDGLETYSYEFVFENDNIINIILLAEEEVDAGYMIFYKSTEGFEYGLNETFLSSDETERLVFNPDNGTVNYELYDSNNDSWTTEEQWFYFKYNNNYYIGGFKATVTENSVTLGNGDIYTKQ